MWEMAGMWTYQVWLMRILTKGKKKKKFMRIEKVRAVINIWLERNYVVMNIWLVRNYVAMNIWFVRNYEAMSNLLFKYVSVIKGKIMNIWWIRKKSLYICEKWSEGSDKNINLIEMMNLVHLYIVNVYSIAYLEC